MQRVLIRLVCIGLVLSSAGCGDGASAHAHATGGSAISLPQGGGGNGSGGGAALGGAAACLDPHLACSGSCVDPASSDQHCGACDAACTAGKHCRLGKCECMAGQTACGDACVDVTTSAPHCGGCNMACPGDGVCKAGHCVAADGCFGPAPDVSISQLIAYQTLGIPIMKDAEQVSSAERVGDIVADRELLLRVFVTPGPGFVSHELSARVHVTADGAARDIFVKGTPQAPSLSDLTSTFNVILPRELVTPDTHYSVELAECGDSPGNLLAPRFPTTGEAALGARETGKLQLHVVPVHIGNEAPDISETRLAYFKSYFEALYPISDFELTLGDAYPVNVQPDFDTLLDDIRALRIAQEPEDTVYYLALSPEESSSGADGLGFRASPDEPDFRVAVSWSSEDAEYTAATAGHELGHNHGLQHSPGCDSGGPDPQYPYDDGLLGIWAYDRREKSLLAPDKAWDIMSYCDPVWFSDYTYRQVVDRVAHVNGKQQLVRSRTAKQSFRVLLLGPNGQARWGHPYTGRMPARAPEPATALDAQGNAVATLNVHRIPTSAGHATSVVIPSPQPGWAAVQLQGSAPVPF